MQERTADCSDCPKVREGAFEASLKCCTYYPDLANFVAGGLLIEKNPFAPVLIDRLKERVDMSPLGVYASASFRGIQAPFGRDRERLCPYYDQQQNHCGIWSFRPSVCASYFCYSDDGAQGLAFWKAIGELLHYLEMNRAQDALLELGYSWPEINACLKGSADFHHFKEPETLFRRCYEWHRSAGPSDWGATGAELLRRVQELYIGLNHCVYPEAMAITRL